MVVLVEKQINFFDLITDEIDYVQRIEQYDGRTTCHQKIKKEEMRQYEQPIDMENSIGYVREISYAEAKRVIVRYEWLGTMPSSPWKNYGLFIGNELVAVECFAERGSGNRRYGYLGKPAICLARGASIAHAPTWAGSYLISRALKLVEKELTYSPCYVLAYADWEAGELGHIYQACSWVYTGHKKSPEWRSPTGERKDSSYHRQISRRIDPEYRKTRKLNPQIVRQTKLRLLGEGWKQEYTLRGRYVTVVGKKGKEKREMIRELELRRVPYVKTHTQLEGSYELTEAQVNQMVKEKEGCGK